MHGQCKVDKFRSENNFGTLLVYLLIVKLSVSIFCSQAGMNQSVNWDILEVPRNCRKVLREKAPKEK